MNYNSFSPQTEAVIRKKMNNFKNYAISAICILALASISHADIAFNNFGPEMQYDTNPSGGYGILGSASFHTYQEVAMQFTSTSTGSLGTITTGFSDLDSYTETLTLSLLADNGSNGFGALLFSDHNDPHVAYDPSLTSVTNTDSSIKLIAGRKYWIYFVADPQTADVWHFDYGNTTNQLVYRFNSPGGSPLVWQGDASLMVTTQAVPEPASFAALGLGLIGLISRRRRS